jgi:hypothetical protein
MLGESSSSSEKCELKPIQFAGISFLHFNENFLQSFGESEDSTSFSVGEISLG